MSCSGGYTLNPCAVSQCVDVQTLRHAQTCLTSSLLVWACLDMRGLSLKMSASMASKLQEQTCNRGE